MRALTKAKTQCKEYIYFAMTFTCLKVCNYYAELTPMMGKHLFLAHITDLFYQLVSFGKWDKGIDINPEEETSFISQYQVVFLKYVDNEYCSKHRLLPVIQPESIQSNNIVLSVKGSRSG